mgnify:CR=1 FL=1
MIELNALSAAEQQSVLVTFNPAWVLREDQEKCALEHGATGTQLVVNGTAFAILNRINACRTARRTVGELCHELAQETGAELTQVLPDIVELFIQLSAHQVISLSEVDEIEMRANLLSKLSAAALPDGKTAHPFDFFDAIFCINVSTQQRRWQRMQERFANLGISERVIRYPAFVTPDSHHVGCTLTHRRIIEIAQHHNLDNVLVFEDDALILDSLLQCLPKSLAELQPEDWNLFYLGGWLGAGRNRSLPGKSSLSSACRVTCTHAIAYHRRVFEKVLKDIPNDVVGMIDWCESELAIDQYLCRRVDSSFVAVPTLCAQKQTLRYEAAELRDRFA